MSLRILLAALLAAATVATWGGIALAPSEFVLDDRQYFVGNPWYRGLGPAQLHWMASTGWMGHWQPLTWLTLALDFERAELEPRAYLRTNLVVHVLAALAVLALAREVLRACEERRGRTFGRAGEVAAALAAASWALHPLRDEGVAWATGRNDALATLLAVVAATVWLRRARALPPSEPSARRAALVLLGLAAWVALFELSVERGARPVLGWGPLGPAGLAAGFLALIAATWASVERGRGGQLAATGLYAASLACKGWGIPLALALLALDAWPLRRLGASWRGALLEKAPWLALAAASARLTSWAKANTSDPFEAWADHGLTERIAQASYGLVWYPLRTLWPRELVAIRDVPARMPLLEAPWLWCALAVVGLAWALFRGRARAPGAAVALTTYALLVAPSLGLVHFGGQLVADRYVHLAGVPLSLLLGGAWLWVWRHHRAAALAGPLLLVPLALAARDQVRLWSSAERLYEHNLGHAPGPRAMANLALAYNERAEREPQARGVLLSRALALATRARDLARAQGRERPEYRLFLGVILHNLHRDEQALAELAAFVREKPDSAEGHANLALALRRAGRLEEAARAEAAARGLSQEP